jgi:hypothetical protein
MYVGPSKYHEFVHATKCPPRNFEIQNIYVRPKLMLIELQLIKSCAGDNPTTFEFTATTLAV